MTIRTASRPALFLPPPVRQRISTWCLGLYPEEACGLLIGRREGDRLVIVRAVWARNVHDEAEKHFEVDPVAILSADRQAESDGMEICGVWHSHPDGPARPSDRDRDGSWDGWSSLIVSIGQAGIAEMRSFRLQGKRFIEESLSS